MLSIKVYDDIECKKADNVGNLFCNLVEPPKNAQRDVEKREQQAHLYAFLAQISGNEYEKNSGSCITTVFTGRQYKYLQGAGTLGGEKKIIFVSICFCIELSLEILSELIYRSSFL